MTILEIVLLVIVACLVLAFSICLAAAGWAARTWGCPRCLFRLEDGEATKSPDAPPKPKAANPNWDPAWGDDPAEWVD